MLRRHRCVTHCISVFVSDDPTSECSAASAACTSSVIIITIARLSRTSAAAAVSVSGSGGTAASAWRRRAPSSVSRRVRGRFHAVTVRRCRVAAAAGRAGSRGSARGRGSRHGTAHAIINDSQHARVIARCRCGRDILHRPVIIIIIIIIIILIAVFITITSFERRLP